MGMQDAILKAVRWDTPWVSGDASLRQVIAKLVDSQGSSLVVKEGDVVAGIITDMDIMTRLAEGADLDSTRAASFMTACALIGTGKVKSPCVQLDEAQTVMNALGVMATAGVHNLMVSGAAGRVGTVSVRDLLRLVIA
ncbi:MAG: CBS domain-containing protein [Thermodesulfobacteriota bacterium]